MKRDRPIRHPAAVAAAAAACALACALAFGAREPECAVGAPGGGGGSASWASPGCDGAKREGARDWEGVWSENPDVVAWLRIGGTPVDDPVLSSGEPYFYLRHDLDGDYSSEGCLTLDEYCPGADSRHVVIYGHHLAQGRMFGSIFDCHEEGPFSALGEMEYETPDGGTRRLVALCASSVHKSDLAARAFDFADDGAYREWLTSLCAASDVRADDWESLCAGAESAVTCVTCTSTRPGQPWRTLVTFVED